MQDISNYKEKACLFNSDHLPIYVNERLVNFFFFCPIFSFSAFCYIKIGKHTGCIYWDVFSTKLRAAQCLGLALQDTAISKWINSAQIQHWSYTLFHIHLGCGFGVDLNLDS